MDALSFLNELNRLCNSVDTCPNYPLYNLSCDARSDCRPKEDNRDIVTAVEQWLKEHSTKTRQSEFLKTYPNALTIDGVLTISPCSIDKNHLNVENCKVCCPDCKRDYWLQEVE